MRAIKPYEFIAPKTHVFELADAIIGRIGEASPHSKTQRVAEWAVGTDGTRYNLSKHDFGASGIMFTLVTYENDEQLDQITIQRSGNNAHKIYRTDADGKEIDTDTAAQAALEDKVFAIMSIDRIVMEEVMQTMVDREFVRLAGRVILSPYATLSAGGKQRPLNANIATELATKYEQSVKEITATASKPQSTETTTYLDINSKRMVGDAAMELIMTGGGRWKNTFDPTLPPSQRIRRAQ